MKPLRFSQNRGFTLIEVIASLVILVISLTMLLSLVNQNLKATQEIKEDAISGFLGEMAISDLYLSSIFENYRPPNFAEIFQDNYEITKGETDLCIPIETEVNYLKYSIGIGKKDSRPRDYYVICLTGEIEGW